MATEESFLLAIREEPDDDGLRLIFADWLEERGDVRGTLMRLQVTRSALAAEDPSRPELEQQEKELLERYGTDFWLGPLLWRLRQWHFQRGLLHVEADGSFFDRPVLPRSFFRRPILQDAASWVERLNLWSVSPAQIGQLANCRYLTALTMLDLHFGRLGDLAAALLAGSTPLAPLRWLDLSGNTIGDAGARELAGSPYLTRLQALHLSTNAVGPEGAYALAASRALSSLKTLDLSYNGLGDRGAAALAASPHLAGLRALYLSGNDIRFPGIQALIRSPYLANLNALHLSGNPVGETGVRLLHQHFGAAVRC